MKLVVAEKPSVARAIAPLLGADKKNNGYTEGNGYIVSWCLGHLVGLKDPDEYCEKWEAKPWTFDMLPMIPDKWLFRINQNRKEQFRVLKTLMKKIIQYI